MSGRRKIVGVRRRVRFHGLIAGTAMFSFAIVKREVSFLHSCFLQIQKQQILPDQIYCISKSPEASLSIDTFAAPGELSKFYVIQTFYQGI
jgi:hypothetical protein